MAFERLNRTAEQVAEDIKNYVEATGHMATLATDWRWWSKKILSPHDGYITNDSIGYPMDISEEELQEEFEAKGLYFTRFVGQSSFGVVFNKPLESKPYYMYR